MGRKKKTDKQFKQEVYEKVGEEYVFLEKYQGTHTKIKCKHIKCSHEWKITPNNFLQGKRCPECYGNKRKSDKQFKKEVCQKEGDNYVFLEPYINNKTKLLCRHNECGNEWKVTPHQFLDTGTRCPKCNGGHKTKDKDFKIEIHDLVGDEYLFIEAYKTAKIPIVCRHNKCGHEWKIAPKDFRYGVRCPKCAIEKMTKSDKQFKKEIKNLVGNRYVFKEKYVNASTKILCRHNKCGHEWETTPSSFLQGKRCPLCNASKGATKINNYLEDNNIDFDLEYSFDDLKARGKLKFDFAIKDNDELLFLIEYDGEQHFNTIKYFEEHEPFRIRKYRDRIKNSYCFNNDIPLLRINYFSEHLLEEKLKKQLIKFNLI